MGRTSVNLLGNCVASAVVARWEGSLDDQKMANFESLNMDTSDIEALKLETREILSAPIHPDNEDYDDKSGDASGSQKSNFSVV
jgi:hypothetical protein